MSRTYCFMRKSEVLLQLNLNANEVKRKETNTGNMFESMLLPEYQRTAICIALIVTSISYMVVVRRFRYRRRAKIESPFGPGKRDLSSMTIKEAYSIMTELQELEFPYAFSKARKIALLKVKSYSQSFMVVANMVHSN